MVEGLKLDFLNAPYIKAAPTTELSASEVVLKLLTGPIATFSAKVDAELANQSKRIKQLEDRIAAIQDKAVAERKGRK